MRMYKNTAAFVRCNPKNQSSLFPLLVYGEEEIEKNRLLPPVSYTHLTLPTRSTV